MNGRCTPWLALVIMIVPVSAPGGSKSKSALENGKQRSGVVTGSTVYVGGLASLGDYRVRAAEITTRAGVPEARIVHRPKDEPNGASNAYNVRVTVRKRDIVPIGGHFFRITQVYVAPPQATGRIIDRSYVQLDEVTKTVDIPLQPWSFVVPLSGSGTLHEHNIEIREIRSETEIGDELATAEVDVWPWGEAKPKLLATNPTLVKTTVLVRGDTLLIGRLRHKVANIVPPDPSNGVKGWVELEFRPVIERRGGIGVSD